MIDTQKVQAIQNNILDLKKSSSDNFLGLFAETTANILSIYFVGVYFIDETEKSLVFRAGNGLVAEKFLSRNYKILLSENSTYAGQIIPAARNGEIRLVDWFGKKISAYQIHKNHIAKSKSEVIHDNKYFCSPNLPESCTEIYLPLYAQGKIIGILELNFNVKLTFSEDEIFVLQLLANHLAELID